MGLSKQSVGVHAIDSGLISESILLMKKSLPLPGIRMLAKARYSTA